MEWFANIYTGIAVVATYAIQNSLFVQLMTLDGLYNACHFMTTYFTQDLTASQIVTTSNNLYTSSFIDKLIFYTGSYIFYKTLCNFLWQNNIYPVYYIIIFLATPPILNKILSTNTFLLVIRQKERISKLIITKQITNLIVLTSNIYLHKHVTITEKDNRVIMKMLENYTLDTICNYIASFLKNTIFLLIMEQIKVYSMYYKTLKYVYKYQTGELYQSFTDKSAKNLLGHIVDTRKWNDLMKPNVFKAAVFLVQNSPESTFMEELTLNCKYAFIKMISIWSIAAFINSIYVIPLLSLLLCVYKNFNKEELSVQMITILLSPFYHNFMMLCFISQFGYYLMYNRVSLAIYTFLYNDLKERFKHLFEINNKYTSTLGLTTLYLTLFWIFKPISIIPFVLLNLIFVCSQYHDVTLLVLLVTNILSSSLSQYHVLHNLHNVVLTYILLGLYTTYEADVVSVFNYIKHIVCNYASYLIRNTPRFKRLDLMDIDKYPSVTDKMRINKLHNSNSSYNNPLNDQVIVNNFTSEGLFDMTEDEFIDAISVDVLPYTVNQNDCVQIESNFIKNSSVPKQSYITTNSNNIQITDNYY